MTFEQMLKDALEEALAPIKRDIEELKSASSLSKYGPVLTVTELMDFLISLYNNNKSPFWRSQYLFNHFGEVNIYLTILANLFLTILVNDRIKIKSI